MPCKAGPGPGEVAAGLCWAVRFAPSARTTLRARAAPAAIGRRSLIPHSSDLAVHGLMVHGELRGGRSRAVTHRMPARNRALLTVGQLPARIRRTTGTAGQAGPQPGAQSTRRDSPGALELGELRGFRGAGAGLGRREFAGLVFL